MKKVLVILCAMILAGTMLIGCGDNGGGGENNPKATISLTKTTTQIVIGKQERLVAVCNPENEQVTWGSADITKATVSTSGLVTAKSKGDVVITASLTNGEKAECTVSVVEPDAPNYPSGEYILKADENKSFIVNGAMAAEMAVKEDGRISTVEYSVVAAQSSWQNYVTLDISDLDITRKTTLGLNLRGSSSVYIKLMANGSDIIYEGTTGLGSDWKKVELSIAEKDRYLLEEADIIYIYCPKPEGIDTAGAISICGVWFDGDKEPGVKDAFDYSKYNVAAKLDLSKWQDEGLFKNGSTYTCTEGTISGVYNSTKDNLSVTIDSVTTHWMAMTITFPSYGDGTYSDIDYIAIKLKSDANLILKTQISYSNDKTFNVTEATDASTFVIKMSDIALGNSKKISFVFNVKSGLAEPVNVVLNAVEFLKIKTA